MHRVLIVYDIPGWAFARRAVALQKYAPADFAVTLAAFDRIPWETIIHDRRFDLVFVLDFAQCDMFRRRFREAGLSGIPLVVSYNRGLPPKREALAWSGADWLIVNSRAVWQKLDRRQRTCCISNGVDLDLWGVDQPIETRMPLVLWCGSTRKSQTKGIVEVLNPLAERLVARSRSISFRQLDPHRGGLLNQQRQRAWYNSGAVILCTSDCEGTPNTSLEGMACGNVLVTTAVGNALEFGRHDENCLLVERTPAAFEAAIEHALANLPRLSAAGVDTMRKWGYGPQAGNRAAYFFQLFRRLIEGQEPEPFSYDDVEPSSI